MFHSDELDAFKGFKAEWGSTKTPEPTQGPPTIKAAAHGKGVALWKIVMPLLFVAKAKLTR